MLFSINDCEPRPVYLQIAAAIKEQVRLGKLAPGDPLPSVRELAHDLSINLHTARHAYQTLREEGVIYLRLGRCARIAPPRSKPATEEDIESKIAGRLRELIADAFHLGVSPKQFRSLVDKLLDIENRS